MLLGLTCGSKSDDYLTRKRLATAQTGKWHKSGNKLKWIGMGKERVFIKREHRVPEKTEIALKLLRSAKHSIDIIVP